MVKNLPLFGMNKYTLLYFKWITNKVLLYSTWNSAQCYVAGWMGVEFGRIDTCMDFPGVASSKRTCLPLQVRRKKRRRAWQPTPVFLPGESHGQRSLAGYSP